MQRAASRRQTIAAPVIFAVIVVLLWQAASLAVPARVLPAPNDLVDRLSLELSNGILGYTLVTLTESFLGCLLGLLVALPLGYLVAHSDWANRAIGPYLAASQAIPAVALAPLIVLWFGYGQLPIALLCALLVFFPIFVNTQLGLTTLDADIIGAAQLDGAGRWRRLVSIEAPLALPSLLAGIRNGFVLSVTGAVVGEFVMGGQGLGLLLSVYRDRSDTEGMFATLIVLAAAAVGIYLLMRALERRVRWW
ncbi:ABC transporter permease [Ruania albidiflava]|uniref:ABC transporter permease n=1 Tax=Ruania albidiflava TaxID=366586 RepID=UPI0003B6F965|nr:ABC transporter permease [Ruania albidiflava]